jgi:hemerythrin
MALFIWNDDYSVGIDSLDADHIIIASLVNHIHEAKRVGTDEAVIGRIVQVLINHAQAHFRREESLLEKSGYPELEEHKRAHRLVAQQLKELHEEYQLYRGPETSEEIVELLSFWLDEHILEVDMKYKAHLSRRESAG